jgi:hypothetical protein
MEANGKPTCRGTTKAGKPCQSFILGGDGYCHAHGTPPEVLAEERRSGGLAAAALRRELAKSARELLRERAQEHMEEIWTAYHEALAATDAEGKPDHRARFQAASALLAEAYGKPVQPVEDQTEKVTIVLAPIRDPTYRPPAVEASHVRALPGPDAA